MNSVTKNKKIINTLQGWRAIMIGMIFILHICPESLPLFSGGYETISFFIILSGFVLTISFKGSDELSFKNIIQFTKKRIKNFYPLHITALFAALLPMMIPAVKTGIKSILDLSLKFVLDSLLVQAFIPKEDFYFSINGVSWYLSATLFFYLMFIPLLNFYKKFDRKRQIILILMNIVLFCSVIFFFQETKNFSYYTYIFPVFRCLEFSVGILLGFIYKNNKERNTFMLSNKILSTVLEVLVVLLFFAQRYWLRIYSGNHDYQDIVGFLMALLIVFVFSYEQGYVSKIISNKVFVFIGNISFEIFIIHTVVYTYVRTAAAVINVNLPIVSITAILTLVAAVLFHYKPLRKIYNKKLEKND